MQRKFVRTLHARSFAPPDIFAASTLLLRQGVDDLNRIWAFRESLGSTSQEFSLESARFTKRTVPTAFVPLRRLLMCHGEYLVVLPVGEELAYLRLPK